MIQMDNLVELEESVAPPQLYRYNRFNSATVSAGLALATLWRKHRRDGPHCQRSLRRYLPHSIGGESRNFRESSQLNVCVFFGTCAHLSNSCSTIRKFQRPLCGNVYRAIGRYRSTLLYVALWCNHEYIAKLVSSCSSGCCQEWYSHC